jgi:hypothetical protein
MVIHVLLDYHWTPWAMHMQMMAMRIDRIANSATQDNTNVKAAVWLVMAMVSMTLHMMLVMAMMSMTLHMMLGPMLVSYALPPCMGRWPVMLPPLLMHAVVLPPTLMPNVVSQRWS